MLSRGCADNQLFPPVFFTFFGGYLLGAVEQHWEDGKLHIISFQVFNFFFRYVEHGRSGELEALGRW